MNATMTRRVFLAASALTPLVLTGCGSVTSAQEPPAINYGRDVCARCGMIISDERFAGALVAKDGSAALYDDVGEMVQTVRETGLGDRRAWAHDRASAAWIDATMASFVQGEAGTTPMGTGIVVFTKREDAEAYAAEHGDTILTWQEATAPAS